MATTVHGLTDLIGLKGTDLGHTGWLAISQDRIDTFADATDDHQWIHVDAAKAETGPFGGKVRLHASVADVAELDGNGVQLVVDCTIENDAAAKPACVAQAIYRVYA